MGNQESLQEATHNANIYGCVTELDAEWYADTKGAPAFTEQTVTLEEIETDSETKLFVVKCFFLSSLTVLQFSVLFCFILRLLQNPLRLCPFHHCAVEQQRKIPPDPRKALNRYLD